MQSLSGMYWYKWLATVGLWTTPTPTQPWTFLIRNYMSRLVSALHSVRQNRKFLGAGFVCLATLAMISIPSPLLYLEKFLFKTVSIPLDSSTIFFRMQLSLCLWKQPHFLEQTNKQDEHQGLVQTEEAGNPKLQIMLRPQNMANIINYVILGRFWFGVNCLQAMIRKALTQKQKKQSDQDGVWQIFSRVINTGDTYVFEPNTPREDLQKNWFAPYMVTYVYQDEQGKILGTYIIKPNQIGLGSHVANASFMVHPEHQGKGIGKRLCQHCLNQAKKLGFKAMQFNLVVSTNTAAITVWKKYGFQIVGTIPEAFNNLKLGKLVDAHVMYRKL